MRKVIDGTNRRRTIQTNYNVENHITPETVRKEIRALVAETQELEIEISASKDKFVLELLLSFQLISELEEEMTVAANNLEFEKGRKDKGQNPGTPQSPQESLKAELSLFPQSS